MKISKTKEGVYIEKNNHANSVYLRNKTYTKAITSIIIVCADTIIVNLKEKIVYLAKRRVKPMEGWWEIGGRKFAWEAVLEATRRNFIRETNLKINSSRFKFVTTIENI